jgi:hypothetical protein
MLAVVATMVPEGATRKYISDLELEPADGM